MGEHQRIEIVQTPVIVKTYTYSPREQRTHHILAALAMLGTSYLSYILFDVPGSLQEGRYMDLIPALLPIIFMAALINQSYPKQEELTA